MGNRTVVCYLRMVVSSRLLYTAAATIALVAISVTIALLVINTQLIAPTPQRPTLPTKVSQPEATLISVVASPDGRRVAFIARGSAEITDTTSAQTHIGYVQLDKGDHVEWVDVALAPFVPPTWSPDGSRLAFVGRNSVTNTVHIVVYDIGTGSSRLLTTAKAPTLDTRPDWGPTGSGIMFHRQQWDASSQSFDGDLWMVRPDDSEVQKMTASGLVGFNKGRWSPDGSQFYYIQEHPEQWRGGDVHVVDINRGAKSCQRVTQRLEVEFFELSPNGQYLLCLSPAEADDRRWDVYLVPVGNPGRARLVLRLSGYLGALPQFSPDGRQIVFCAGQSPPPLISSDIWKMPLIDKTKKVRLVRRVSGLAWRNAWTERGQIIFTRDNYTSIWVVNDDGTSEREIFALPNELQK